MTAFNLPLQTQTINLTASSTTVLTPGAAPNAANTYFLALYNASSTIFATSVTQTGVTWKQATGSPITVSGSAVTCQLWGGVPNVTAPVGTNLTIGFNGTASASGCAVFAEWGGCTGTQGASSYSGTATAATSITSSAVLSTYDGDLYLAILGTANAGASLTGSANGWAELGGFVAASGGAADAAYFVNPDVGTATAVGVQGTSGHLSLLVVAYEAPPTAVVTNGLITAMNPWISTAVNA